jgi:hypothetical protein
MSFQVEFDSSSSPNIQLLLPSGIAFSGISSWIEMLARTPKIVAAGGFKQLIL